MLKKKEQKQKKICYLMLKSFALSNFWMNPKQKNNSNGSPSLNILCDLFIKHNTYTFGFNKNAV